MEMINEEFRPGIIVNPHARASSKAMPGIEKVLAQFPNIPFLKAVTPDDMQKALFQLAAKRVNLLVISGGDGTVHAAVCCLLNRKPFRAMPVISLIQGGTANLTAKNLGLRGRPDKALHRLLRCLCRNEKDREPDVSLGGLLKINTPDLAEPLYGFLFGAGLICRGIRFFHHREKIMGKYRIASNLLIIARFLWALASGNRKVAAPVTARIAFTSRGRKYHDISELPFKQFFLIIAGTIPKLILGIRPCWIPGQQGPWCTTVGEKPRRLFLTMAGRIGGLRKSLPRQEDGYSCHIFRKTILEMRGDFTVDGELYSTLGKQVSITIEEGPGLRFLKI